MAQVCYCGSENCRGELGGKKDKPVRRGSIGGSTAKRRRFSGRFQVTSLEKYSGSLTTPLLIIIDFFFTILTDLFFTFLLSLYYYCFSIVLCHVFNLIVNLKCVFKNTDIFKKMYYDIYIIKYIVVI